MLPAFGRHDRLVADVVGGVVRVEGDLAGFRHDLQHGEQERLFHVAEGDDELVETVSERSTRYRDSADTSGMGTSWTVSRTTVSCSERLRSTWCTRIGGTWSALGARNTALAGTREESDGGSRDLAALEGRIAGRVSLHQGGPAAAPDQHAGDQGRADQHRHVTALEELEQIGDQERDIEGSGRVRAGSPPSTGSSPRSGGPRCSRGST